MSSLVGFCQRFVGWGLGPPSQCPRSAASLKVGTSALIAIAAVTKTWRQFTSPSDRQALHKPEMLIRAQ